MTPPDTLPVVVVLPSDHQQLRLGFLQRDGRVRAHFLHQGCEPIVIFSKDTLGYQQDFVKMQVYHAKNRRMAIPNVDNLMCPW